MRREEKGVRDGKEAAGKAGTGAGPSVISGSRLRPLNAPLPLRVEVGEDGFPTVVRLDHRPRSVTSVREAWRIDDEWWRRPISRWYLTLVLEDGRLVTVFRDLVGGGWYLQEG